MWTIKYAIIVTLMRNMYISVRYIVYKRVMFIKELTIFLISLLYITLDVYQL